MSRRALIMAGGTGGHIFPGLAVAQELRERGWRVDWLGQASGMEAGLVAPRGIELHGIEFGGVRGKGLARKLGLPLNLLRASRQAARIMDQVAPHVVLGMGGYVTVPGGLAARQRRVPLVIHEQNSVAGLANRMLSRIAQRVIVAFQGALPRSLWAGNPVDESICHITAPTVRYSMRSGPLRLLVLGGSLGALALNEILPAALGLLPESSRPQVLHQSGTAHIDALREAYARAQVTAQTVPFIDDMASAYADADLVIARAGAMTVAEVACAGIASVLVPYPHAVDDHQTHNARWLSASGAAVLVRQGELNPSGLASLLSNFDREGLSRMGVAARGLARPDATAQVADACVAAADAATAAGGRRT